LDTTNGETARTVRAGAGAERGSGEVQDIGGATRRRRYCGRRPVVAIGADSGETTTGAIPVAGRS